MKSDAEIKAFINSEAGMKWQMNTDEGFKCVVKGADAIDPAMRAAEAQNLGVRETAELRKSAIVTAVEECAIATLGGKHLSTPSADRIDTERPTRGGR